MHIITDTEIKGASRIISIATEVKIHNKTEYKLRIMLINPHELSDTNTVEITADQTMYVPYDRCRQLFQFQRVEGLDWSKKLIL